MKLVKHPTLLMRILVRQNQLLVSRCLTSVTPGTKYPWKGKPFPYTRVPMPYRMTEWVDKCAERYVDNSRLVAVDGNLAVGKHAFATKLASYFDLQPVYDFDERLCFPTLGHKFIDLREFDSLLPPAARPYDRAALFMDPSIAPHAMLGGGVANYATKLQVEIYKQRYFHYFDAVAHLLNTGQGSTIVRPMHSDYVYYEALRRCGWITDESFEYYNKYSLCLITGC